MRVYRPPPCLRGRFEKHFCPYVLPPAFATAARSSETAAPGWPSALLTLPACQTAARSGRVGKRGFDLAPASASDFMRCRVFRARHEKTRHKRHWRHSPGFPLVMPGSERDGTGSGWCHGLPLEVSRLPRWPRSAGRVLNRGRECIQIIVWPKIAGFAHEGRPLDASKECNHKNI